MSPRQPDLTRDKILKAAYAEIHRHGFQSASIANILADTGLTKGALYHHFPDKKALGLAVLEEVIRPALAEAIYAPLAVAEKPVRTLVSLLEEKAKGVSPELIALGCPLNNLIQEMSPIDEDFRLRLNRLFKDWQSATVAALKRAQAHGEIRADIDCDATALFLVASVEGCVGMAKNMQSKKAFQTCLRQLQDFLLSLAVKKKLSGRKPARA